MNEKRNAPAEDSKKNSRKKMLWIGAAAAVVLLIGVGVIGYLLVAREEATQEEIRSQGNGSSSSASILIGPMVDIEPFIVNILEDQGTRYLKAAITLEVDGEKTAQEISDRMPQVRDAILLLVSNKTYGELEDLQGKLQLRAELLERLDEILQSGKAKKIYFTDFVIQ